MASPGSSVSGRGAGVRMLRPDEGVPSVPLFPTDPWFQDLMGGSTLRRTTSRPRQDWEGDIAFLVEAEPDRGMPDDIWGSSTCGTGRAAAAAWSIADEGR